MPDSNRKLPDWIDGYMRYTQNTEPPLLFRKWTAISVIASVLQRKCRVEWGSSLTFYPNLYIILVGPSASGKGTAMGPGLDLLQDLAHIKIAAQATSLQALIRRLKETNYSDVDLDTGEMQMHSSLTIFSKEFTVFLGFHNREMMSTLCDWYDCDRYWSYETIARKKEEVIGPWVNLFGATTPALIQSSMPLDAIGGGLTSRIIYVYEEKRDKIVALPMETQEEKKLRRWLLQDLEKIYMLSGAFKYTSNFMDAWAEWCREIEEGQVPFEDNRFDGYIGRRRNHVMKLSMVMCASTTKNKQMIMTRDDFERALQTLIEVEKKMTMTFSGVGKSDISSLLHRSMIVLKTSTKGEMPVWQFSRLFKDDMDHFTLMRVLDTLEEMKQIHVIRKPGADNIIKVLNTDALSNNRTEVNNELRTDSTSSNEER